MGDQEFEKFFEENHGDGERVNPSCHQRLMLDVISDRADTINNMYNATVEFLSNTNGTDSKKSSLIPLDLKTIRSAEGFLIYLMEQAKTSIIQSDYLISRILDEFDPSEGEKSDESKPK